jgi:putative flippase GtrA
MSPRLRSWVRLLGKHQLSALAATVVDYGVMIALVELLRLGPAASTALGAACGALVNFTLGRTWIFRSTGVAAHRQLWRYALVSAASLGLNTLGVHVFATLLGVHYLAARLGTGLAVSVLWNFPMQRHFVFRHGDGEGATA